MRVFLWVAAIAAVVLYLLYRRGSDGEPIFEWINMSEATRAKAEAWARAITDFESGGNTNAKNYRMNNPGNLKDPKTGQFRQFATFEDGWNALIDDLEAKIRKYPNWTLTQIMTRYLGGDPNNPRTTGEGNPFSYAAYIANRLGVSTTDTLKQIFG